MKSHYALVSFLAVALLLVVSTAGGARVSDGDLPDGVTFTTSVEGIDEYRLDNGLRVLLFPDEAKQTTTVNVTYLVGSLHEGYGETGMAHLLEHLVFKGSPKHTNIAQELTAHGARPNGSTWFDRTNYFETFAATDENLEWALDMEADRMVNSFISAEDLESEMTVVRNEFEIGENYPEAVLEERVYSTAYLWHNYGNTTIGARSDIEGVPIENLQAFYHKWYRPENAILVVAGKFDQNRTMELVQAKFGPLTNPEEPLPELHTEEPAQDGARSVTLRRVGDKQVGALAYHIPAGSYPDYPALQVMAFLLGDSPSGRLHKALVETKKATDVRASADRFKEPGLMYAVAELRVDGNLDEAITIMIDEVEGFAKSPPTAEEVERAKQNLLRNWEVVMRDSPRAAIRLSEWAAMGDWRMVFVHRDWLENVTVDDVVRVAGAYFDESNRTVGRYIPTEAPARVEIPSSPPLDEMLAGYTGREAMAQGETFDVSPMNIEDSLQRTTLASGLEVITLPKKNRAETVSLAMSLHFGSAETLKGKATIGEMAGGLLMRGTKTKTRQQIEDEIARLQLSMRVRGSATGVDARIEATRAALPDAIRLLVDVLKNPAFPEDEYEQLLEEKLQQSEEGKNDPRTLARVTLTKHMRPWPEDDVRYTMSPEETIASLKACGLPELAAFHEAFYGCSAGELSIVGDFDVQEIRDLVAENFNDWKSKTPYERLTAEYQDRPAILEKVETPDKESAVYASSIRMNMSDRHEDYPAMVIGSVMTGGGFLSSRLATRIRQNDGLSYGVGAWFYADSQDENAWFTGFAIYNPENDEKLVKAFREEIEKVRADGFTEEELAEAKNGWLQRREVSRGQDRELASIINDDAREDRTMRWEADLEQKVAALTTDQVLAAFRRHMDPDKMSVVRAGDFAGAKAKKAKEEDQAAKQ